MITSNQSNLQGPMTNTHVQFCFAKCRQRKPPSSTLKLASIPYQCWLLLSRFKYINSRTCPGMSWTGDFSPQNLPLHTWGSGPHQIHGPLGPPKSTLNWHRDQFSHFCTAQCSAESPYTLQWAAHFPPQH